MTNNDLLDEIISAMQPEHIPAEFIVMARVLDKDGTGRIVKGDELEKMLRDPVTHNMTEARVILDVRKIKRTIAAEMARIYASVGPS